MAFDIKGLTKLGHGSVGTTVHTLFVYWTNDTASAVETTSYFDGLLQYNTVVVGDTILAHVDIDGTPDVILYAVTAVTSAEITVTPKLKSSLYTAA